MVILNYFGEIWKDIPDFEGFYQASNFGRVRSLDKYINVKFGSKSFRKGKILKLHTKENGYLTVGLSKNGKQKHYKVHRLVWKTFHGAIPDGYEINHIDEDKTNNRLDNLELVTHKENMNWGTCTERATKARINGKKSKPVIHYDLDGNYIKEFPSQSEVQREFGYLQGNISACCRGKYKQAFGYIWKYKENAG